MKETVLQWSARILGPSASPARTLPYWRLSSFYLFYFASLGALVPYWGLYLEHLGFDAVAIGSLMSILMATKVVAPNLWGWLADRLGHRMAWVRLAALLTVLGMLGLLVARGFWGLALVMALFSFFWNAALPQFEAVTLDHLGDRPERYARIRLWGSVGFILAVVGVGRLVDHTGPAGVVWAVLVTFIGVLGASLVVPDHDGHTRHEAQPSLGVILRRPEVIALLAAVFLMQASHGPYYAFYTIYLQDHGYSKTLIGLLWSLGVVAEVVLFLFMHRLMARFRPGAILAASLALAAVRWLLIGWFVESLPMLALAQLLHAASFGSFHASAIHLFHHHFRGRNQGRGQALYSSLSFGAGGAVGTFASGFAWDTLGPPLAYTLASATALAGAWVMFRRVRSGPIS